MNRRMSIYSMTCGHHKVNSLHVWYVLDKSLMFSLYLFNRCWIKNYIILCKNIIRRTLTCTKLGLLTFMVNCNEIKNVNIIYIFMYIFSHHSKFFWLTLDLFVIWPFYILLLNCKTKANLYYVQLFDKMSSLDWLCTN